ncbi:hypothetical protein GZH53_17355 [Flavihumibacter sp. R14]|nr:hypothetical protein [Flavihumibacter soli]
MVIGIVKWYDLKKGFGLIGSASQPDFKIRDTDFVEECISIASGDAFAIQTCVQPRKQIQVYRLTLSHLSLCLSIDRKADVIVDERRSVSRYNIRSISLRTIKELLPKQTNKIKFTSEMVEYFQIDDIEDLVPFLQHLDLADKAFMQKFETFFIKKFNRDLLGLYKAIPVIRSESDLMKYNGTKSIYGINYLTSVQQHVDEKIKKAIIKRCDDKVLLWENGLGEIPNLLDLCDSTVTMQRRINFLSKLDLIGQLELLKLYSKQYGLLSGYSLLERFVMNKNSLNNFALSTQIFNQEYWIDKTGFDLLTSFNQYVEFSSDDQEKLILYCEGLYFHIDESIITKNVLILDNRQFIELLKRVNNSKNIVALLLVKAKNDHSINLSWLCKLANDYLEPRDFELFNGELFELLDSEAYLNLWESGEVYIFPKAAVVKLIHDMSYEQATVRLDRWAIMDLFTSQEQEKIILECLKEQQIITSRETFRRQYKLIKLLHRSKDVENVLPQLDKLNNPFYSLILWFFGRQETFDFEFLKNKFIYFDSSDQIKIIKRLFYLCAQGDFSLTVEKLNEIKRVDVDLYKIDTEWSNELKWDLSIDIIIKGLVKFKQEHRFLAESELLACVLENLYGNNKRKFSLGNFFEECSGRMVNEFNWKTKGSITKRHFGNSFYFAISFEVGEDETNHYGHNYFVVNPHFKRLKEKVKELPGRKWNSELLHWGVPKKYEEEVYDFAKKERFFIDLPGNKYINNVHLVNYKRSEKPPGIKYCEGRLANKKHDTLNRDFWWCRGGPCFENCETSHNPEQWERYTLLDFCNILGFDTDERNKMQDLVPKGQYYKFVSLINRFGRLLERLYCNDCGQILFPTDTSHFAAYTVVRFSCNNDKCGEFEKEVYLTHCLNGRCSGIIDSRISQRCSNGLIICDDCGTCCSHEMFKRRLENLSLTGGYIHPELVHAVANNTGHLERGEYYCYKCQKEMSVVGKDLFQCNCCYVRYDTSSYNFNRPHKLRKQKLAAIWREDE